MLSETSLMINTITRRDKGVYQCLVSNQKASGQAMAELKLGGKYIQYAFSLLLHAANEYSIFQTQFLNSFIHLLNKMSVLVRIYRLNVQLVDHLHHR